jgi:para-aminobenzoate synthetase / 4-amino-4-deoxychorismate lyase
MTAHRSPDRHHGVFETLLVLDGRLVELDAHMARLRASLETLFGAPVPDGAEDAAADAARGVPLGRLRLTVSPNGGGLTSDVRIAHVDPAVVFPQAGVRLAPLLVPGGLGAHKWADRRLLEAAETDGSVALLVDADGAVLEASRANMFIVEDGGLVTPPADGRILPGVTRARVIELLGAREEPVSKDRLAAAEEVFLSGSVRGIEPVKPGPLTRVAATDLRRHWEAAP